VLFPDGQCDLREQAAEFDAHDAPNQLVSPADLAEISPPRLNITMTELPGKHPVDLAFRQAVMTAGRLHRLDFSVVDPLLQGGIADAQNVGGFPRRQKLLHDPPPSNMQNIS